MIRAEARRILRLVCAEDKAEELFLACLDLLLLLLLPQIRIHADVVLPLVLTEVQNLEGAVWFSFLSTITLYGDHALAACVYGKLPEIGTDPLSTEFFCNGHCGARTAEEIGN